MGFQKMKSNQLYITVHTKLFPAPISTLTNP